MKTHFSSVDGSAAVCGRTAGRMTAGTFNVSCLKCMSTPTFKTVLAAVKAADEVAYAAQVPCTVKPDYGRVNYDGIMECQCGGILWREKPRSRWSYHYVCSACNTSVHPPTETGMCE